MEIKLGYVLKSGNLFFRGFNVGNNDNLFVLTNEFELALQIIEKEEAVSIANEIGADIYRVILKRSDLSKWKYLMHAAVRGCSGMNETNLIQRTWIFEKRY